MYMQMVYQYKRKKLFHFELPVYRRRAGKIFCITMMNKAKIFVFDAGKVIMVISLILWVLSTYGPQIKMQAVACEI